MNGSQLLDVPWQGAVCLRDAEDMTRSEFEDAAYSFGREFGVDRRNVNINDYFLEVLSGGEMQTQEAVTVIGLGTGILLVSVLVIYSVFYLSVAGRVRQFGQLRTIGMTRRQIRRMVRIEGLILCAVGIPAGLAVGGLISYLIRPSGWSWLNMLLISACVTAADIVTVLCSVRRPAKIAASISPVDAARYNGYSTDTGAPERRKRKDGEKPARRITPGSLAVMSSFRNKKKTALTMISLGIGGVLYMLAAFYVSSTDEEEYARQGEFAYGEFVISYSYNLSETAEYGEMQLRVEQPLDDVLADRIRDLDGVEEVLPVEKVPVLWEADGDSGNDWTGVLSEDRTERLLDMEHQGQISYADMAENGQIIAVGGEQWEEVYGWELEPGDDVTFHWYDGQDERQRTFEVAAVVDRDDFVRASDALPGERTLSFLIPDATMKEMMGGTDLTSEFVVKTDMDKADQIEESLCGLLEGYPYLSLDTLRDRILQTESMFTLLYSVIVGLSLFIIAFALINLLNTLITSILTRDHEFAMLQSVGMTRRQLVKMLGAEALMISAGNLFITFALGTAAGYVMIRILRYFGADYMRFTFPVWFFAGYAVFIVLVPILITVYMVRMFQRQTLADRLRRQ